MQRQHLSQRVLSMLLVCVMFLTCAPTALAESTEAAMMRLMKTEGTVSVTNAKGRSVKTRDDMRLNSGYGLETEEASYAWINLDDAKLVKMDAVSEISIRKSGKKLDILLDSGNLFFNVSKPLEEDETFHIRTSTMGIGIRGTCGWVKVIDQWTTLVYVLEGTVQVTVTDPVTGETKTETVKGGETVTCKVYPQDTSGSKCDIIRQTFKEDEIDGFVLVELVVDRSLCDKIKEDSGLDILGSGVDAEKKLKEDQAAVHEKLEKINGELAELEHNVSKDPVWTNPVSDGTPPSESSGSDSGSSGDSGSAAPAPTVNQELVMPQTDDTVNAYLSRSDISGVTLLPGTARASTIDMLEVDSGINVPAGKTLVLRTGVRMEVLSGQTVALGANAHVTIGGAFISAGNLTGDTGATVKATLVDTTAPLEDWKQSDGTDGAGYYTLTYSPKGVYTITFNANGGSVSPASSQTGRDSRLVSLPTPTWAGHDFDGWFTAAEGGEQITTATVFAGDTTVYAHWTATEGPGWRFDRATGTLYILDDRAMVDYTSDTPWNQFRTEIRSAVVSSGVTRIGGNAFLGCSNMTGVTLPNTVTSIGSNSFVRCSGLTSISIPNSVTSIGSGALVGTGMTRLDIPVSVTRIDRYALNTGSLRDIYYGGTEAQWNAIPNVSSAYISTPLRPVTVHYNEVALTYTVTFNPNGGTVSPTTATTGTDGQLTSLPTPTRTGFTFNGWFTASTGGTAVTTETVFTRDTTIYAQWTEERTGYTITFDANGGTVSPASATTGADGRLTSLPTPTRSGYTFNGWFTAATGGTQVTASHVFTADTTVYAQWTEDGAVTDSGTAGDNVFWEYTASTKTLRIWGSGPMNNYESRAVFLPTWEPYFDEIETVVIEEGVTSIGSTAFEGCGKLTNISIPTGVTSIGHHAFRYCHSLTGITIPEGVTTISSEAFDGCRSLTSLTLPSSLTLLQQGAFRGTSLTSLTIPESVTTIEMATFCRTLIDLTLPATVTYISPYAFTSCDSLTNIYYKGTQTQWQAIRGLANIPDTATIHCTDGDISGASIVSDSAPSIYTDVPSTASYAEAVRYCADNGIMTGTSDTEFTPDGTLTRAMMVTVLHRLAGKPFAYATGNFADVEQGKWYSEAVSWASGRGIVNGYNPTTFGTNDPVTHEQVGLILQRYSGDQSIQVAGAESPKSPATRAEVAMTLMNYAKNRKPGTLSEASAIDVMCSPSGIALDKDGNLMVTDVYGKQLWRVQNRNGTAYAGGATVLDLYGQPMGGYNDASLQNSYFKEPWAIAPFLDGWAVSDTANNVVRLVGVSSVQTLNGATNEKLKVTNFGVAFDGPTGLASDDSGNLYVSDTRSGAVRRVNPDGGVATVAKNLSDPTGLCWKDGVLYIAETGRNRIVKLEKGKITTVAGSGTEGMTDGSVQEAAFSSPQGVAVGDGGNVYVADTGNGAVRVIKGGTVTTLAVRDPEQLGGGLMSPVGLLVQGQSLYICDTFARRIFVYQLG